MAKLPAGFSRRKDGLLEFRFMMDGRRRSVYGTTTKECQEKRDKLRDKLSQGLLTDRKSLTLQKYYEEWRGRREAHVKPSTLYAHDRRFKKVSALLGNRKLSDIERRDVFKLQKDLQKDLTSKGVNDSISLLRSVMESAVNDRLIPYNPAAGVKSIPKTEEEAQKNTHRFLAAAEIETFFRYAEGSIYYNLFRLLLLTGVRCGEAGALTWGDIDTDNGLIHITKTVTRVSDREYRIGPPKTQDSKRDIELTSEVSAILRNQREQQSALFGLRAVGRDRQVFTTSQGALINQSNTCPVINSIVRKASRDGHDMQRFTPHAFRHTFISYEIAQGVLMNVIARQVGHSNTITLQKYYSHEDPEKLRAAFRMVSADMARLIQIS